MDTARGGHKGGSKLAVMIANNGEKRRIAYGNSFAYVREALDAGLLPQQAEAEPNDRG